MNFLPSGLISKFLEILGVSIESSTGQYIAFIAVSALVGIAIVSLMSLIFKFLVFLRKG